MGKIIFWLVVAFVVLLIVRLINARHTLQMRAQQKRETTASETTVRCGLCGVFVPRSEARQVTDGFRCGNEACWHS